MAHALGFEIVDFYLNGWPENHYVDDYELTITEDGKIVKESDEGGQSLPLDDKYDLHKFGFIYHEEDVSINNTFAHFFRKWKKNKTTSTILIEVPKEHEESMRLTLSQDSRVKVIK